MTNESGIASALMDFAKPLMGTVADDARPDDMTPVLDIAVAVWNAVVLESTQGKRALAAELRTSVTKHASGKEKQFLLAMLDVLEKRKRAEAPLDTRVIRSFKFVKAPDGGVVLRVECHAASSTTSTA